MESNLIHTIDASELGIQVATFKTQGYRLVQISVLAIPEAFEVTYSFDHHLSLQHLRILIPKQAAQLQSITPFYAGAFTYENEIQDLFGVTLVGLQLDFHGHFYQLSQPTPFVPPA